jgi:hypothetical protein
MNQYQLARYAHLVRKSFRNREGYWEVHCERSDFGRWSSWSRRRQVAVNNAIGFIVKYDINRELAALGLGAA